MNEQPKKNKPKLIVVGTVGVDSTVAMQFAQTMQNDLVVVNSEDIKESFQENNLMEKLNEKVYVIEKLPEIEQPFIMREFSKNKKWYEGKHKKHRK